MSNKNEAARLSPDARRDQILGVAKAHFAREGQDGVSVQAIAADAGVARALIYHYFPGRDALLDAVLAREAEALLAATAPDPALSRRANLERALGAYLDHFAASTGRLRDLYAPRAGALSAAGDLAARNHAVQAARILHHLGQPETPVLRLAVGAWLGFVTEAAREAAGDPTVARVQIITLCMAALQAVTGTDIGAAGTEPGRPPQHQEQDP